jgi:hypothetical protein
VENTPFQKTKGIFSDKIIDDHRTEPMKVMAALTHPKWINGMDFQVAEQAKRYTRWPWSDAIIPHLYLHLPRSFFF